MLAPTVEAIRLFLHVLAASVWVGGQIVLAGMVPTARKMGTGAPGALARAFARISWPAYGLLVATGFWNIAADHVSAQDRAWQAVLAIKIAVVALAGIAALLHGRSQSPAAIAFWGSVTALASVAAMFMGILLAG